MFKKVERYQLTVSNGVVPADAVMGVVAGTRAEVERLINNVQVELGKLKEGYSYYKRRELLAEFQAYRNVTDILDKIEVRSDSTPV
jgi:hypothetical protein